MPRIRGTGLGTGMALGTAAVIRERNGIPVPPAIPDRIAVQIATHRVSETPEIVLVARDYTTALALSSTIQWARVAAIAAETAPADAPVPPFPAVFNLPGLVNSVQDDVLMLVDAGNNFIFPDPDPMFLAQYTLEHDRIAPKRRLYLDEGHYPAQTIDGQTVQVIALIDDSVDQVQVAMDQGADGVFVPYYAGLQKANETAQRKQLFGIIHAAAGKPLILADAYTLPPILLCEAAVEADITVAAPRLDEPGSPGLPELQLELERMENSCFDNDVAASIPRLATLVVSLSQPVIEPEAVERWVESAAASGATRVVFSLDHDSLSEGVLLELENYLSACARNLLPAFVAAHNHAFNVFGQNDLEDSLETAITLLVGAGITGIIVSPDTSEASKRWICQLDAQQCREDYWRVLQSVRPE